MLVAHPSSGCSLRESLCPHRNWNFISYSFKKGHFWPPSSCIRALVTLGCFFGHQPPFKGTARAKSCTEAAKNLLPELILGPLCQNLQLSAHGTRQGKCPVSPELCPPLQPDFLPAVVYLLLVCCFNRAVIFFFFFSLNPCKWRGVRGRAPRRRLRSRPARTKCPLPGAHYWFEHPCVIIPSVELASDTPGLSNGGPQR